jgi:hypothetical protein
VVPPFSPVLAKESATPVKAEEDEAATAEIVSVKRKRRRRTSVGDK